MIRLWDGRQRGKFYTKVSPEHYDHLRLIRWGGEWSGRLLYARGTVNGECWRMHRYITGTRDEWIPVDHRNGDPLDNRYPGNLFPTTPSINAWNRNLGRMRGIKWIPRSRTFKVTISTKGKQITVGYVDSEIEAIELRRLNERLICGIELKNNFTGISWCGCRLSASELTIKHNFGRSKRVNKLAEEFIRGLQGSRERGIELRNLIEASARKRVELFVTPKQAARDRYKRQRDSLY